MCLRNSVLSGAFAAAIVVGISPSAFAQGGDESYIGSIFWTGANFCPRGTAEAAGQLLSISSNTALFSLLGTFYGGNGTTTFALPDLRGRSAMGFGQGPGLSGRDLGEQGGAETYTLSVAEMAQHVHSGTTTAVMRAASGGGVTSDPTGNVLANGRTARIYSTSPSSINMSAASISAATSVNPTTGGGQPFPTLGPSLVLKACITTEGLFPPRP